MTLRSTIRLVLCVVMLASVDVSFAQIKLIPKSRLDSVANPRIVGEGKMTFKPSATIDFGELDEDAELWQRVVEWQNNAKTPLVITHIKSSCSCLSADVERRSVEAGKSDKLKITYYPKGHPGAVAQRLFIYTNLSADQPTAILRVIGRVKPSLGHSSDYSFHRGALLIRQDTIYAKRGKSTIVRIACMNSSDKAMSLTADTLLTSKGVKMWTEPKILAAGAEGDLVVSISADATVQPQVAKPDSRLGSIKAPEGKSLQSQLPIAREGVQSGDQLQLYIRGLALPPRERSLVIKYRE